jgi:hypothetical protein
MQTLLSGFMKYNRNDTCITPSSSTFSGISCATGRNKSKRDIALLQTV